MPLLASLEAAFDLETASYGLVVLLVMNSSFDSALELNGVRNDLVVVGAPTIHPSFDSGLDLLRISFSPV